MRPDLVQAICFDIGGTLVQLDRGTLAMEIAGHLDVGEPTIREVLIGHGKRRQTSPGELADLVAKACGRPDQIEAITTILENRRTDVAKPHLFDETIEVLQSLADAGWPIFYLSNAVGYTGPALHPPYFSYATAVFHSWEIGVCTPEREAFDIVARAARLPGSSMLHVGDSWDSDIMGAVAAGWQAVHVDRLNGAAAAQDRQGVPAIRDLRGLLRLLPHSPSPDRTSGPDIGVRA